jgi:hypothetical protein
LTHRICSGRFPKRSPLRSLAHFGLVALSVLLLHRA